jgi:hypothetical protein
MATNEMMAPKTSPKTAYSIPLSRAIDIGPMRLMIIQPLLLEKPLTSTDEAGSLRVASLL